MNKRYVAEASSAMLETKRSKTVAIQESLLNGGDLFPLSFFDTREYVQHNLSLEDGVGAIFAFVDALPKERTSARVIRSFEDGDFSVAHAAYELGNYGRVVGFEIHRWEDGRIVEHWDNLQSVPSAANSSGRTMIDGETEVVDRILTSENKLVVASFTDRVMVGGEVDALEGFFIGGELVQHDPGLGDGVEAFRRARESPAYRYDRLHKVIGEGCFALTLCEGVRMDSHGAHAPVALYDLYRMAAGAIVEHWNVIESIPPRAEWRNANGKF